MEHPLILRAALDGRPVSAELRRVLEELEELTDKLSVEYLPPADDSERPCVRILRQDGEDTGIAFHGVPGGHELSSFVIALYNAAGPGQSLEPAVIEAIARIDRPVNLKVLVSLSCTMCPELVMAAQRIAAASAWVTAEAYDLNHFPASLASSSTTRRCRSARRTSASSSNCWPKASADGFPAFSAPSATRPRCQTAAGPLSWARGVR